MRHRDGPAMVTKRAADAEGDARRVRLHVGGGGVAPHAHAVVDVRRHVQRVHGGGDDLRVVARVSQAALVHAPVRIVVRVHAVVECAGKSMVGTTGGGGLLTRATLHVHAARRAWLARALADGADSERGERHEAPSSHVPVVGVGEGGHIAEEGGVANRSCANHDGLGERRRRRSIQRAHRGEVSQLASAHPAGEPYTGLGRIQEGGGGLHVLTIPNELRFAKRTKGVRKVEVGIYRDGFFEGVLAQVVPKAVQRFQPENKLCGRRGIRTAGQRKGAHVAECRRRAV